MSNYKRRTGLSIPYKNAFRELIEKLTEMRVWEVREQYKLVEHAVLDSGDEIG